MGDTDSSVPTLSQSRVPVDTFAGRIHVEWDPSAAVTPMGQLPFFIEFLKVSGLFEAFVAECPLRYTSPNSPSVRDVLGTLMLSILAGHNRYAHITAIRCDSVNPALLGMKKVISEDAARRALIHMNEEEAVAWLDAQLSLCTMPLVSAVPVGGWILDTDVTVKPLYGKQEGAVVGYNPKKPGRPSHAYHSYFMANTRLALRVEVRPGNETSSKHVAPGLWNLLDSLPREQWPAFIRGDVAFGTEPVMREAEERGIHFVTKLRLTKNVTRLIQKLFAKDDWVDAGQGFSGIESTVCLTGWSRSRRVVVLRRPVTGELLLNDTSRQLELGFIEIADSVKKYEYAVLVTSLPDEVLTIAQHYRDRADSENCFDELKNQWGWGGFTTQDLKRCRLMSRLVALIYNWWSLFVRLANPDKHHEAITSRPLLLHGVAKQTTHAGQTCLTITSNHTKASMVQAVLQALTMFFKELKVNAEQLSLPDKVRIIAAHAFRKLIGPLPSRLALPAPSIS